MGPNRHHIIKHALTHILSCHAGAQTRRRTAQVDPCSFPRVAAQGASLAASLHMQRALHEEHMWAHHHP